MGARGFALFVHTYAPRSVDVAVDDRIVASLREAYRPEVVGRWPLRPEVDLITRDPDGRRLADEGLVTALHAAFARAGIASTEDHAYTLQPSTMAAVHAMRFPGRTLCFEMRRDLLVAEFTPFAEMRVDPAAAERMAGIFAEAVGGVEARGAGSAEPAPELTGPRADVAEPLVPGRAVHVVEGRAGAVLCRRPRGARRRGRASRRARSGGPR